MDSEKKLGGLCFLEGRNEWEPTVFARIIRAGYSTKAISYLRATSGSREEERKKETALLLSKGYHFGGGGQQFEIKYAEEKPVRGKISSKRWPFSLSDGFANQVCFGPPLPTPSPHLHQWLLGVQ